MKFSKISIFLSTILITGLILVILGIKQCKSKTIFKFPKPTGQSSVGTKTLYWTDDSRTEKMHNHPNENRELIVQLWYPSQTKKSDAITAYNTTTVKFLKEDFKNDMDEHEYELFSETLNKLDNVYSYAVKDASISLLQNKYPVLIFSHGYGTTRNYNTALCEEFASHGYIVVGIEHPYISGLMELPNGKQIRSEYNNGAELILANKIESEIKNGIKDVQFVLNQLGDLNSGKIKSQFKGHLDLDKIGIIGHSYGGIIATHMCRIDSRCKAGINLDAPLFGKDAVKTFNKPFMFFIAEEDWNFYLNITDDDIESEDDKIFVDSYSKAYLENIPEFLKNIKNDTYKVIVGGAVHNTFTDLPLLFELLKINVGSIEPKKSTNIIRSYSLSFFDKYLLQKQNTILDSDLHPAEVTIEKYDLVSKLQDQLSSLNIQSN